MQYKFLFVTFDVTDCNPVFCLVLYFCPAGMEDGFFKDLVSLTDRGPSVSLCSLPEN